MKHVVVGGDGFVGRHLAQELLARHEQVLVADIQESHRDVYRGADVVYVDITDRDALMAMPLAPDDVVYNLAARMLDPIPPWWRRREYFWSVNYRGTENLLECMSAGGCKKLVFFTTDMVYGHLRTVPADESQPREPLGHYGDSKRAAEDLCAAYRDKGMHITIFRPRLIIGPGRLGILRKLFWLIDHGFPVPLVGDGSNHYQFISVFDCVSAAIRAFEKGVPNRDYNLGSKDPPTVRRLLSGLIKLAGKRSRLVKTPARLVKAALGAFDTLGLPLMDPEQYLIADEDCILDISKAQTELDWHPRFRDDEMLYQAYREYRQSIVSATPALH